MKNFINKFKKKGNLKSVDLAPPEAPKKDRSIEEIQGDYQGTCLKAGHIQYQIYSLEKELSTINELLRGYNLEASTVQAKKKAEEAPKAPEVVETKEETPNVQS